MSARSLPSPLPQARRILVAEDDAGVRVGLVANLELEGYEVVEARDGGEALALLAEQSFDLVVSDVVMPTATGVEVLAALRGQHLKTPLILVSAFIADELVGRAIELGLFAMLYKPFPTERILAVVARALCKPTVLLVDDQQSYVSSWAPALSALGMCVEVRRDSRSALALVRQGGVDVCVLDLLGEPLDGLALCQALRSVDQSLDMIAVTATSEQAQLRTILQQGVATCLRQPFELSELLTALARLHAATRVAP